MHSFPLLLAACAAAVGGSAAQLQAAAGPAPAPAAALRIMPLGDSITQWHCGQTQTFHAFPEGPPQTDLGVVRRSNPTTINLAALHDS